MVTSLHLVRDVAEVRRTREVEELRAYEVAERALVLAEMPQAKGLALAEMEENIRERGFAAGIDNLDLEVQCDFKSFQTNARVELQRLEALMIRCLEKYTVMAMRWERLAKLPDMGMGLRQPVPQWVFECSEEDRPRIATDYLNRLYSDASMIERSFFEEIGRCVEALNAATWPKDLGLDEQEWPFQLRRRREHKATLLPCCWLRIGPMKDRLRSEIKIAQDYADCAWPQGAHLLDIIRCAVAFDDPYAVVAFAEYLGTQMQVGRMKNKFRGFVPGKEILPGGGQESEYRDLLLNIEFKALGVTHAAEVQLAFRDLAALKQWSHRPYKVDRMANYTELLHQEAFTGKYTKQPVPGSAETTVELSLC